MSKRSVCFLGEGGPLMCRIACGVGQETFPMQSNFSQWQLRTRQLMPADLYLVESVKPRLVPN